MEKEFLTYEDALALKELGYKEKCLASFYTYDIENFKKDKFDYRGKFNIDYSGEDDYVINTDKSYYVTTPLYPQAFRWFREKGIYGEPTSDLSNNLEDRVFVYSSYSESGGYFVDRSEEYDTYEEAQLACLRKLIERLKQNKHE